LIICDVVRPTGLAATIGIHNLDFRIAITLRIEKDLRPIGRPAWSLVVCLTVGKLDHIVTIRVYDIVFIMTSIMR
jgi:hypothetical protein